jgi:glucosamine--fructose-6-phosphate aminotransferase (isomerizing)
MLAEAREAPAAVTRQLASDEVAYRAFGIALRERPPAAMLTGCDLPLVETGTIGLDPISAIQSFYTMVEALARARGLEPDQPQHLTKVTRTR